MMLMIIAESLAKDEIEMDLIFNSQNIPYPSGSAGVLNEADSYKAWCAFNSG